MIPMARIIIIIIIITRCWQQPADIRQVEVNIQPSKLNSVQNADYVLLSISKLLWLEFCKTKI